MGALAACPLPVRGIASPAGAASAPSSAPAHTGLPGGAQPTCLVVDNCGADVAALPEGLRCADLQALGLGPKQAVDYRFLWGMPALMDADANGIPCETVWPDVAQYLPSNY